MRPEGSPINIKTATHLTRAALSTDSEITIKGTLKRVISGVKQLYEFKQSYMNKEKGIKGFINSFLYEKFESLLPIKKVIT